MDNFNIFSSKEDQDKLK